MNLAQDTLTHPEHLLGKRGITQIRGLGGETAAQVGFGGSTQ